MTPLEQFFIKLKVLFLLLTSFIFMLEALVKSLIPRSFRRKDVTGQVVLITGGGSGIGREVARGLAAKGAKIVSWDINEKGNSETAKLIEKDGGKCFTYTVNICDRQTVYTVAEKVKTEVGRVDILINNAGIVTGKPLLDCPDDSIQRTFDVNAISHFWTLKAFLPDMKKRDSGHIVTIASLAGIFGANRLVDYCASKFAAVGLDESLRQELLAEELHGIKTTVVCPNFINTGMFAGAKGNFLPELQQDDVGREIVDAILMNVKVLYQPHNTALFVALKGILPLKTSDYMAMVTGTINSMEDFKGRSKSD